MCTFGLQPDPPRVQWRALAGAVVLLGSLTLTGCAHAHAVEPGPVVYAAAQDAAMPGTARGWEVAAAAGRWVAYVGVLLAAGGALFLAGIHDRKVEERRRLSAVVVAGGIAAGAATLAGIPLQAVTLGGAGARAAADPRFLIAALDSPLGASALARLVGLSLLLVGIARALPVGGGGLSVAGGGIAVVSFALQGHSVTADPWWLAVLANACHTAAAALWFGGLVLLGLALRARGATGDPVEGAAMVARFSLWVTAALPVIVVAGAALAWVEIRSLQALSTPYGWTVLAKAALVAAVAAVGVYNNRLLVPAIRRAADGPPHGDGAARAWRRLSVTVRMESWGLVIVLAVTAFLVNVAPPRGHGDGDEQMSRTDRAPVIHGHAWPADDGVG